MSAGNLRGEEAEARRGTESLGVSASPTVVVEVAHDEYVFVLFGKTLYDSAHDVPLSPTQARAGAGLHVDRNGQEIEARFLHPEPANERGTLLSQAPDTSIGKTPRVDLRQRVPDGESAQQIHSGGIVKESYLLGASFIREDESPGGPQTFDRESRKPLRLEDLVDGKDRGTEFPDYIRQHPTVGRSGVSSLAPAESVLLDAVAVVVAGKHADIERPDSKDRGRAAPGFHGRFPRRVLRGSIPPGDGAGRGSDNGRADQERRKETGIEKPDCSPRT
jgi:hypothetical protein